MINPYPHYKPSGVDWLGDIPQHWEVKKIAHGFTGIGSGTTPASGQQEYYMNGDINWLQTGDLTDSLIDTTSKKITGKALADYSTLRLYPAGSVVMAMYGATIGKVGLLQIDTTTNQACCVLPTSKIFNGKYVFYWLISSRDHILSLSSGGGQPNINQETVRSLRLPCPTLAEQATIANYLDVETARLDMLIEQKRRLIDLLQDERAGLINEAVTQGLNHRAPRKDSGLPWLGEIPAHWEVKKLKYVIKDIIDTAHKTVPFKENGDYYVVRTSDVRKGNLLVDNMRRTDREGYLEWTERAIPEEGDIFFTREAPAGEACVVPGNIPVCLGQRMVLFKTDKRKTLSQFIVYQIYSVVVDEYVCQLSQGSTVNHFNMADIRNIPLVLPDINEQAEIVAYLDTETSRIDDTIRTVEQEIGLLVEYRSALISEVVTGKLKVS